MTLQQFPAGYKYNFYALCKYGGVGSQKKRKN